MRIATWNVNSVNARLETVLRWFEEAKPDVACLQEIKCVDEKFPSEAFERLGYNVEVSSSRARDKTLELLLPVGTPTALITFTRTSV